MQKNEILVIYGEDMHAMTLKILESADLAAQIPAKNSRIGIKPNIVGTIKPEQGATTHPEIIAALIEYLQGHGFENLLILEGAWVGDNTKRAFKALGYEELSRRYHVPLLDTKHDRFVTREYRGIKMEISETALNLDFLINVPVLKGHCQTKITGALKNLKGIISDHEKRHFHTLGLHEPIAYLNHIICADFVLGDGICGDLEFEEGGNPIAMNRIFAGLDSVLVDSYIATSMGYEPDDIRYITIADEIGIGSKDIAHADIHELNRDTLKVRPAASHRAERLSRYVTERDACSACYANLIQALARLEDSGELSRFPKGYFAIGQGFKDKTGPADHSDTDTSAAQCIGIGNCTRQFSDHIAGCPARAADILHNLNA